VTPTSITCEHDGTGSARFEFAQIVALIGRSCCDEIERELGRRIEPLGVRFVDALGREVEGAITDGVTLVGFRLSARNATTGVEALDPSMHKEGTP
jgi:hypothetical protein